MGKKLRIIKEYLLLAACVLTGLVLLSYVHQQHQQKRIQKGIAKEIVRFHILANSDDEEDQQVKLMVRDEISAYMKQLLSGASGKKEAEEIISSHLPEICQRARESLPMEKKAWKVKAELSTDYFPEKEYGDCTFPAGWYQALRITLGKGEGHNWWCVMYPNLCFMDESCKIVSSKTKQELRDLLTEEEYENILKTENGKIHFGLFCIAFVDK